MGIDISASQTETLRLVLRWKNHQGFIQGEILLETVGNSGHSATKFNIYVSRKLSRRLNMYTLTFKR